jgi:hypothetical protein
MMIVNKIIPFLKGKFFNYFIFFGFRKISFLIPVKRDTGLGAMYHSRAFSPQSNNEHCTLISPSISPAFQLILYGSLA